LPIAGNRQEIKKNNIDKLFFFKVLFTFMLIDFPTILMSKNIGLDFSPLMTDTVGGIPTYIKNLSTNLANFNSDLKYFQCYKFSRLKKFWKLYPKPKNFKRIFYDKNFVKPLKKLNVFHGTAEWLPLKLTNIPKIITIHDTRGLDNDISLEKRYDVKYAAIKYAANIIVTVTYTIKNELLNKIKNLDEKKIKVIHSGYNENFKNISDISKKEQILFVGTIAKNKNVIGLIQAFKIVNEKYKDIKLIICGQATDKEYYNELKTFICNNSLEKKIEFIYNADNEDLLKLYNESLIFILPSFYEGFGLPVLEAQACGCPVIISEQPALLEITNNSAIKSKIGDVNDLAEKIMALLNNETLQQKLIKSGFENIKAFSWKITAEKYIDLYKSLI